MNGAVSAQSEPSSLRLIGTLSLAGLISGLALVSVYELTLPRITANKAEALRAAVLKVVPNSHKLQKLVRHDGVWGVTTNNDPRPGVYAAYSAGGEFRGYAITGEGPGFQDTIELIYGFDPATQRIVGMEVLESRETPGLGDKVVKDAAFHDNFRALAVSPRVKVVKNGQKSADNEVDAITGATISSKAVVKIINQANKRWLKLLPGTGAQPPLQKAGAR